MPVVDFHTHILPKIDDGSGSVEESLAMLRLEAEQGVERVIATPHFYANHQSPQAFIAKRTAAEEILRAAMKEAPGLPELSVGAEIYFFEGISDCEFLPEMAIQGTKCVLIEMPMKQWSERNLQELVGIRQKQKLTPIVAHIDRYIRPLQTHKIPERLAALPVLVQANASFFIQRSTQRLALKLLREEKIHLLGSDCHNTKLRTPNLAAALEVIEHALGEDAIRQINLLEKKLLKY